MRYATLLILFLVSTAVATAKSPTGWSGIVLPTGDYREDIKSMPIETRPGRFLHVYGNTVRLFHYSDSPIRSRPMRQIFFGTNSLMSEMAR
ncbi:hypothetical protein [Rhodopirellula sp. MGV]|uniref:hypothetical protein n=1 Tax=Rhodopirellula sp. MGV TaxID=2023130 RepID=UPI000B964411|nr:hypothetical protein [Rhodopirellula sp. MGV]PNY35951.1 hypothetical protein C2E31_15940 [Rhodopirellula baltica]